MIQQHEQQNDPLDSGDALPNLRKAGRGAEPVDLFKMVAPYLFRSNEKAYRIVARAQKLERLPLAIITHPDLPPGETIVLREGRKRPFNVTAPSQDSRSSTGASDRTKQLTRQVVTIALRGSELSAIKQELRGLGYEVTDCQRAELRQMEQKSSDEILQFTRQLIPQLREAVRRSPGKRVATRTAIDVLCDQLSVDDETRRFLWSYDAAIAASIKEGASKNASEPDPTKKKGLARLLIEACLPIIARCYASSVAESSHLYQPVRTTLRPSR